MRVITLVAGGTGGHFFPAVALGGELSNRGYAVHIVTDRRCQGYIGTLENSKITFHVIDVPNSPGSFLKKFKFYICLIKAVYSSIKLLCNVKPVVLVGFGGYPVVSSILAAIYCKIPIVIHEQNSCMGRVNKFFAKYAKKVALAYAHTKNLPNISKSKIIITGGIVRENIRKVSISRIERKNNVFFKILIFGGSQGAKIFTKLIPSAVEILMQRQPNIKLSIIQQVQYNDLERVRQIYHNLGINYDVREFFSDIEQQYQDVDLVIARAGASTIEELIYTGLPSILIPLPTSSANHQYYNAKQLSEVNGCWYYEQKNITAYDLADKILQLINNYDILRQVSQNLLQRKKEGHKLLSDLIEDEILI